jgi:ABC-type nitrate/sulfonate/bicarbonate transport system substrate-binding protein
MITRRKALGQIGTFSLGTVVGMSGLASPVIDMAPFFAALKLGYFEAENIEVDTTPAPGGAAILPALAAGQFEAAFSNTVSILLAIQEGIEFRFITGGAMNGPEPPDVLALYARRIRTSSRQATSSASGSRLTRATTSSGFVSEPGWRRMGSIRTRSTWWKFHSPRLPTLSSVGRSTRHRCTNRS